MITLSDLSEDQLNAYNSIIEWGRYNRSSKPVLVLGGYAGTGKSSVLGVFARESGIDPIAFCAYTGKAASVLRRKLLDGGVQTRSRVIRTSKDEGPDEYYETGTFIGRPYCGTIHGLIYMPVIDDKTGKIKGWEKRQELDVSYKLIVIDEGSMVNDEMLSDLRNYGVQILLVGDHGQLPPVSGMGSLMQYPDIRLEKIHRQAEGNPIIQLSAQIRKTGQLNKSLQDDEHVRFEPIQRLKWLLKKRYQNSCTLFDKIVLVYTNKRRAGINQAIRETMDLRGAPTVNEQVICLRNQRDINVYNGMRGLITRDQGRSTIWPWQLQAEIDFVEDSIKANVTMCAQQFGRERTFDDYVDVETALFETTGKRFTVSNWKAAGGLYDFGYALTVHKSQGSGFDDVWVVAERPGIVDNDGWKRWLYTSVTRSIRKVTIFS